MNAQPTLTPPVLPGFRNAVRAGILCSLLLPCGGMAFSGEKDQRTTDHYWRLGVGAYGSDAGELSTRGHTLLDRARFDWILVCHGSYAVTRERVEMYNRFLAINPDLKFLVRLWPIVGLGHPENRHLATFLDYFYKPGVKEKLLERVSEQVTVVLDHIDKPENVLGFTFLEEEPGRFGAPFMRAGMPEGLWPGLERYREAIEAERGQPLAWDEAARRWLALKHADALAEIHAHTKKVSGGKWNFVWLQANLQTLDFHPEGASLMDPRLVPAHYADWIRDGVADGFFVYPNNAASMERHLALAAKNNWLFFSQVSHPPGMRLGAWQETLRLAKTKVPQNLGFFLYCDGDCRKGLWNDDPSIPTGDNFGGASTPTHLRRIAAQEGVGMQVIEQQLVPDVRFHYDSVERQVLTGEGAVISLRTFLRNTRDASWFLDEEDAWIRNVRVELSLPEGVVLNERHSPPASLALGDIEPGGVREVLWWPTLRTEKPIGEDAPVVLQVMSDSFPAFRATSGKQVCAYAPEMPFKVRYSGQTFLYPGFHLRPGKATNPNAVAKKVPTDMKITLECVGDSATHPSVAVERNRFIWQGNLLQGETLEILPGMKALLRSSTHPEGVDVSDKLFGRDIRFTRGMRQALNEVQYEDRDRPSAGTKILLSLEGVNEEGP